MTFPARPATSSEIEKQTRDAAIALPIEWAEAMREPHAGQELVEGLIPAGSLIVEFGPSGSGKTFSALDMGCHIAAALPWNGRRVRRSIVLYVAAEAGPSIRNRVIAWRQQHEIDELPLAAITIPVDIRAPVGDVDRIIETATRIGKEQGAPVGLIVVDTLSRAFGGGDENSSEDMGALVGNVDRIRHETSAAVLLVHHAGKDTTKGARGHSLLRAAADVEIEVANSDGIVTATVTKHRDGTTGATITGKLRPVEIGTNAWGDPLATCVLEAVGAVAPRGNRPLPKGCELALRALRDAISDRGEALPATSGIPPGTQAVTGKAWRDRYYVLDALDVDDPAEIKREREARKKRFTRARQAMLNAGIVGAVNDWHWLQ